jgi:hypothetical protein
MEVEGLIISDLTGGFSGIVRQRGAPPQSSIAIGIWSPRIQDIVTHYKGKELSEVY